MTTIQLPTDVDQLTEDIRSAWWGDAPDKAKQLAGQVGTVTPMLGLENKYVCFEYGADNLAVLPASIVKYATKIG